jgi:excisionase family DNA binding protein
MALEEGDRYLTVAEVAERLRLHPVTVRRHIKAGRIRAIRIGRAVRVPAAELRKFGGARGQPSRIREEVATYQMRGKRTLQRRSQPTEAELERRRKAVDALLAFRASLPPLGISTDELLKESRRELEERDERRARPSR